MGRKVIDRTGEEGYNSFGSKIVIKEYRKRRDIDVYFPEYDWIAKHVQYNNFKKGTIECPYEPRVYGVGYLGEGKYTATENGKKTDKYKIYYSMLQRCYDPKHQERYPTYKDCRVEDYLLNFQHMGKWIEENYYKVPGERINTLFVKNDKTRGENPIGVSDLPSGNYQVMCNNRYGKNIYLGTYTTKEEAFQAYKNYKEKVIKEVIDSYEGKIPEPHYSRLKTAMYNYKVEIDD